MKSLQEILNDEKEINKQCNSERADLIRQFVDKINEERKETKYKPISSKIIAIKLGHLKLQDLYTFLSLCKDYKNRKQSFSKYFFGALKIK